MAGSGNCSLHGYHSHVTNHNHNDRFTDCRSGMSQVRNSRWLKIKCALLKSLFALHKSLAGICPLLVLASPVMIPCGLTPVVNFPFGSVGQGIGIDPDVVCWPRCSHRVPFPSPPSPPLGDTHAESRQQAVGQSTFGR